MTQKDKVFNEKSHAFIAAKYYEYLKEEFGDRGVEAFIHGTIYYASQRGRRMAQRAIRDGKELNYETYSQYGEWINTDEIKSQGIGNENEILEEDPNFQLKVRKCPWRAQFVEMGAIEANMVYCKYLDSAIMQGFNPQIKYEVDLEGLDGRPGESCYHFIGDSVEGKDLAKRQENLRDFDYHCGHSYWAYSQVAQAIFKNEGAHISYKVLKDFEKTYGKDAADTIFSYKYTNFNVNY